MSSDSDFDDADVVAVEKAIDGVLDKVQANLDFPYSEDNDPPAPSVALDYHFSASIEVRLDTEWEVFDGFVLTGISLRAAIDKSKNSPAALFVELSASATVGDVDLTVTGRVPRLSAGSDVSFVLSVTVAGQLETLDPSDFIANLTSNGYKFGQTIDQLGTDVASQVDNNNSGTSFAVDALLVITKPSKGSLFLRSLELDFASDLNWTIIQDHLQLTQLSLSLVLDHPTATSAWTAKLNLSAAAIIKGVKLQVNGDITLGEDKFINLAVAAGPLSMTAPEDLLNVVVDPTAGSIVDKTLALPPSASGSSPGKDPFAADILISNDSKGWYVAHMNVNLFWQTDFWFPLEDVNIALNQVYICFGAQREPAATDKLPSDMPMDFSATLAGVFWLGGLPIAAVAAFDSKSGTTTITCQIDDTKDISLQAIAADASLNLNPKSPRDISQQTLHNNMPDSVPVDLQWCSDTISRSTAVCTLQFSEIDLTEIELSANYQIDWQVTSQLTLASMGIYFDITYPLSNDPVKPSSVIGCAYGSVTIAEAVNIWAFVAGVAVQDGPQDFFIGLSLTYHPSAPAGIMPQTLFKDAKFLGGSPPTDLWFLPASAPTSISIGDTITSVDARVQLEVSQYLDTQNSTQYLTKIRSMQASVLVNTDGWSIFDTIKLSALSINMIVTPAADNQIDYYAQLCGVVPIDLSTVGGTKYVVILAASLYRNVVEQKDRFTATVTASYLGAPNVPVDITTFLQMPLIGMKPADVLNAPSFKSLPPELSLSPARLLDAPIAQCSLVVEQSQANNWQLQELNASVAQRQDWVIIKDKLKDILSIVDSTLSVKIIGPRSSKPQIQFSASTSIKIGTQIFNAAMQGVTGGDGSTNSLTFTFSATKKQQVDALTDLANLVVPSPNGCDILSNQYVASITLVCRKTGTDTFGISTIEVQIAANNLDSWTVGPFALKNITLTAVFDFGQTGYTTVVSLAGTIRVSNTDVTALVQVDSTSLELTIATPLEPTDLVSQFVTGGLSDPKLLAPDLSTDTGLANYSTNPSASAAITFLYANSSWYADTLTITVESKQPWTLSSILWASSLKLQLQLSQISSTSPQLQAILKISFDFKPPPGFTGNTDVPCSLIATQDCLTGEVDLSNCTLQTYLYVATGGYWDPGTLLDQKILDRLELIMDWKDGWASFKAICGDWNVIDVLPRLAKMESPRLEVDLDRKEGIEGFQAQGQLAGTAYLLGLPVPISYDLLDGPFRVCGVDVKRTYEMAQRLYQALEDLGEVAETVTAIAEAIADLAALAALADVAGDIFAGLFALGVLADILGPILQKIYNDSGQGGGGGGGGGGGSNHDDPSNNTTNGGGGNFHPGSPGLVVGGMLLSSGPADEECTMFVYPKNKNGVPLTPLTLSSFVLSEESESTWINVEAQWEACANGVKATLSRPNQTCPMKLVYSGNQLNLEYDFTNTVQTQPSVFSLSNSTIDCPARLSCKSQGSVVLYPKDQNGQFRYGPNAAPTLGISLVNTGQGPAPSYDSIKGFAIRNDALVLPFYMTEPGIYSMTITDTTTGSKSPPRVLDITVETRLWTNYCKAYGDGLCSGVAGAKVTACVSLKDQDGNDYTPAQKEDLEVAVVLSRSGSTDLDIPWQLTGSTLTASYNRPAVGSYTILVTINGVFLGNGPFKLLSTQAPVALSVAQSTFTFWNVTQATGSGFVAAGDLLQGYFTAKDQNGNRWYQSPVNCFDIIWPEGIVLSESRDNGDGTYAVWAKVSPTYSSTSAVIKIVARANPSENCVGSPMTLIISPPRLLSQVDAYGDGLDQDSNKSGTVYLRGQDQYGLPWKPVLGTNCTAQLVLNGAVQAYTKVADNTFSYLMPASGGGLLLLSAMNRLDTNFKARIYPLTFGKPSPTTPKQSFVSWDHLRQGSGSVATLYVVDSNGRRKRQGGDLVQASSLPNCPLIITTGVQDNLDGSYALSFVLPDSAFINPPQKPQPQYSIAINSAALATSPVAFPIIPSPMVAASADGLGLRVATLSKTSGFFISCYDGNGTRTAAGFHGAEAYLVQTNKEVPAWVTCQIGANSAGVVPVTYNVPFALGTGNYQLFVFVNGKQLDSSPTTVSVTAAIDDVPAAYQVTSYTLGRPWQLWDMENADGWNVQTDDSQVTMTALNGTKSDTKPLSWTLLLPTSNEWFEQAGFMFSCDISIDQDCPLEITPLSQSTLPITMTWSPGPSTGGGAPDNTKSTVVWKSGSQAIKVRNSSQVVIMPNDPATLGFLYLLSQDQRTYSIHIFHAGQYITQGTWPNIATMFQPPIGISFGRLDTLAAKITVSNVKTIPSHFHTVTSPPSAPESSTDIILSSPWASKYILPHDDDDGAYTADGLAVTKGDDMTHPSGPQLSQSAVPKYGASVSVFQFSALQTYEDVPLPSYVLFGREWWLARKGYWSADGVSSIGSSSLVVDSSPSITNTVMLISGSGGTNTLFANGQLEVTYIPDPPTKFAMVSEFTKLVWRAVRVVPGLMPLSTSSQAGAVKGHGEGVKKGRQKPIVKPKPKMKVPRH